MCDNSGTQQLPCGGWNSNAFLYLVAWQHDDGTIRAQRIQKELPHLVGNMITVSIAGEVLKIPDVASDGIK